MRKLRAIPRHRNTPPTVHNTDNNKSPPTPSLSILPSELLLLIDDHLLGPLPDDDDDDDDDDHSSYPGPIHPNLPPAPVPITADNLSFRSTTRRIATACAAYPSRSPPRRTDHGRSDDDDDDVLTQQRGFRQRCHRDAVERERGGTSPWWVRACAECCGAHGFWMFDAVELVWAARAKRRCFGWAEVWEAGALRREESCCFGRREAARWRMGGRAGEQIEEGPGWTEKLLKGWMSVVVGVERVVWVVIKAAWMVIYILLHSIDWVGERVNLLGRRYRSVGEGFDRLKASSQQLIAKLKRFRNQPFETILAAGVRPT